MDFALREKRIKQFEKTLISFRMVRKNYYFFHVAFHLSLCTELTGISWAKLFLYDQEYLFVIQAAFP